MQILFISGDIESNPGPSSNKPKRSTCANRPIRCDHRRSLCSTCNEPLHLKCSLIPSSSLRMMNQPVPNSLCVRCAAQTLPFAETSISSRSSSTADSTTDVNFSTTEENFSFNSINDNTSGLSMLLPYAGSIANKVDDLTNRIYCLNPRPAL